MDNLKIKDGFINALTSGKDLELVISKNVEKELSKNLTVADI